jgi:hypothetical protein
MKVSYEVRSSQSPWLRVTEAMHRKSAELLNSAKTAEELLSVNKKRDLSLFCARPRNESVLPCDRAE